MSNLAHPPLAGLADAFRIIEFMSYDEIAARPNFRANLTREDAKPVKIIGVYVLRQEVKCGLPDHTPHRKGLVVLTVSGYETIIGNVCGTNHFGEEFQVLRNRANLQVRVQNYQDRLIEFRQKVPQFHAHITGMRKGAAWAQATVDA